MESFIRVAMPKIPLSILLRCILCKGVSWFWCSSRTQNSMKLVFGVKSWKLNANLSFGAHCASGLAHRQCVQEQVAHMYTQGWK